MSDDIGKLCSTCAIISCCTLTILMIISFSSLEFVEYGLDYSSISKRVNPNPYGAGIHWLGIGHRFIKYPRTVINIEFSNNRGADGPPIRSRTSEGLEVQLEISFQYRLNFDQLEENFQTYYEDYHLVFTDMAIHVLSDNSTAFRAVQFFAQREKISDFMKISLNAYFETFCFSNIEYFQLRAVDLPDLYEKTIQITEVKKQVIERTHAEYNKVMVELETKRRVAELNKLVIVNLAKGDANKIIFDGEAQAVSTIVVNQVNSEGYKYLKGNLGYTGRGLNTFLKTKIIRNHPDESLSINYGSLEFNDGEEEER